MGRVSFRCAGLAFGPKSKPWDRRQVPQWLSNVRWNAKYRPLRGLVDGERTTKDEHARDKIYKSANRVSRELRGSYTRLDVKGPILDDSDVDNWMDEEATRAKIEAWVKNFAENEFPAMNKVIVNCLSKYEAEQNGG